MAGSVNKVILIGNLRKDPETRNSQAGDKIVSFNLATSETWNDEVAGERTERTECHRVVVFNTQIEEIAERYLKKGAKVYVEGQLQTRKWSDQVYRMPEAGRAGCDRLLAFRHGPGDVKPARTHIASMADLVGGLWMPQGPMTATRGTEIVVDLLFFQRRTPGQQDVGAA